MILCQVLYLYAVQMYAKVKNYHVQVVLQIYAPVIVSIKVNVPIKVNAPIKVNVPVKKDVLQEVIVCQSILRWRRILRQRQIRQIRMTCWRQIHPTPIQGHTVRCLSQSRIHQTRTQDHIVRRLTALYTSIGSLPCKKNMHLLWRIMHLQSSSIPKVSR
jgi:hypothetical protein